MLRLSDKFENINHEIAGRDLNLNKTIEIHRQKKYNTKNTQVFVFSLHHLIALCIILPLLGKRRLKNDMYLLQIINLAVLRKPL